MPHLSDYYIPVQEFVHFPYKSFTLYFWLQTSHLLENEREFM